MTWRALRIPIFPSFEVVADQCRGTPDHGRVEPHRTDVQAPDVADRTDRRDPFHLRMVLDVDTDDAVPDHLPNGLSPVGRWYVGRVERDGDMAPMPGPVEVVREQAGSAGLPLRDGSGQLGASMV